MNTKLFAAQLILGAWASSLPAVAENIEVKADSIYPHHELSEVVITRYKTNPHNLTPASISSISSAQLQAREVRDITDLSSMFPNFYIPDYGSRQTTPIGIRGVMSKVKGTAVGFCIDGVNHFETSAYNADMMDVKGIEVYRGPQGTLYGRNTIGGVINVYTYNPFEYQGTKVKVGYGNYNNVLTQFSNYTRLSAKFGFNIGGYYQHRDGYFKNIFINKKADNQNLAGGKIGLYYNPSKQWKLRLNTSLDHTNQGGYPYAPFNTETQTLSPVSYNRPSGYKRTISTTGFMAHYQGNGFSLNSQTTYQHIHDNQKIDQDFTDVDKFYVTNSVTENFWNQEVIVKSETQSPFQWIGGLYGFAQTSHRDLRTYRIQNNIGQYAQISTPTDGAAIFAQGSYNVWRGLSATAGLRLDYEHSKLNYASDLISLEDVFKKNLKHTEASLHYTQLIPKFGLQYKFNEKNQVFANITRGYKAGSFNQTARTDDERSYAPEYNWNYELGAKLSTKDNRLFGELTLFYIDWRNQHVSSIYPGIGNIISNAGHSNSKGVELSLSVRPLKNLMLQGNYGYTYAQFLEYMKNGKIDYSGNMIPLVPRHTMAINGQYTIYPKHGLDMIRISANMTGTGKLYWLEDNTQVQNFYALLGGKVALQKGMVTFELWGKNLTNTNYLSYYFASSAKFAQQGAPLTFGANVILDI